MVDLKPSTPVLINHQKSSIKQSSFLPSPLAADPLIPNTEGLEHLDAVGIAHCLLDLIVSEAWPDLRWQVGQLYAQGGGLRHMLLQLGEVDLVVRIGDGVVVFQVVCLNL